MQKLSPSYRADDVQGLPGDIRNYLDKVYLSRLKNSERVNPKLLIVFSGGSAVGKSTLSRVIQDNLGALVISNDEIKECLLEYTSPLSYDERNTLTWQYSMDLYSRLGTITPNGLVVRDGVIDWYFDRILPLFERQHYTLFIIGFDISDERRIQLIKERGDKPTIDVGPLIKLIPEQNMHIERFRRSYTPNIVVDDDTLFDSGRIVRKLEEVLLELNKTQGANN